MAIDIIESLVVLGYENPFADIAEFESGVFEGPKNLKYTNLVHQLVEEIRTLCSIEKTVNQITDPKDSKKFSMEVCAFLKEINCPYKRLIVGYMHRRPQTEGDRLLLLNYLVTELMAARMVKINYLKENHIKLQQQSQDETIPQNVMEMWKILKVKETTPNTDIRDKPSTDGTNTVGTPMHAKPLTPAQWEETYKIYIQLYQDYFGRRQSLLAVFDATIKNIINAHRIKAHKRLILYLYETKRAKLRAHPDVNLMDIFASHNSKIKKISKANVLNMRRNIQPLVIGQVPDYGGRIYERQPPTPPVPGFWHTQASLGGFGRGHNGLLTTATGSANVGLFSGPDSNAFGGSMLSPWNQGDDYLNPNRTIDWNQIPSLPPDNFNRPNLSMPFGYNHDQSFGLNSGMHQLPSDFNLSPGIFQNPSPGIFQNPSPGFHQNPMLNNNTGINQRQSFMPQGFSPIPDFGLNYDLNQAYILSQAYNQLYGFTRPQNYPQMPNLNQALGPSQAQYRPELYGAQGSGVYQRNLTSPNEGIGGIYFAGGVQHNLASGYDFMSNANNQNTFILNGREERH